MTVSEATILLVEDEQNDVFFVQRCFEKARLLNPLQVVHDGDQAMEYLKGEGDFADRKKHPLPCMVLLDLRMPRTNGFELLEWLQTQPSLKKLKAVVMTSSSESPDIDQALQLGAASWILKPPTPEALLHVMNGINGQSLALRAPDDPAPSNQPNR
jgi:CheY-like chemotaxis protein